MNIKQLREALAKIPNTNDDLEVEVWLPGSYIYLGTSLLMNRGKRYLIEGNIRPGSALDTDR